MKKILSLLLVLVLSIFLVNNVKANMVSDTLVIVDGNNMIDKEDYVFSQEELQGTSYEGSRVEVIDGIMYVDGRSITSILIWIYCEAHYVLAAYLAAGGTLTYTQQYPPGLTSWAIQRIQAAWNSYSNMTDAYLNSDQSINSIKLSNGNICYPSNSGTTYACMYSLENEDKPYNNEKGDH